MPRLRNGPAWSSLRLAIALDRIKQRQGGRSDPTFASKMNCMIHLRFVCLCVAGMVGASAAAAGLPDTIRQAGAIHASVNAIYPPMEYKDTATGQLTGMDIELGEALAKRLGVRMVWSESAFEQLMPSLQTGRADLIISGLTDRVSRHEVADFIDYLKTGAQFYVQAASAMQVAADLCGK